MNLNAVNACRKTSKGSALNCIFIIGQSEKLTKFRIVYKR